MLHLACPEDRTFPTHVLLLLRFQHGCEEILTVLSQLKPFDILLGVMDH